MHWEIGPPREHNAVPTGPHEFIPHECPTRELAMDIFWGWVKAHPAKIWEIREVSEKGRYNVIALWNDAGFDWFPDED